MGWDGGFQLIVLLGRIHYFCFVCVERTEPPPPRRGRFVFIIFFLFVSSDMVGPAPRRDPRDHAAQVSRLDFGWGTKGLVHRHFPSVKIFDEKDELSFAILIRCTNSLQKLQRYLFFLQFRLAYVAHCRSLQPYTGKCNGLFY